MAQDLSASAAAASLPSPPLSDQEHPSLPRSYVGTCYNTVLTHSTIGPRAGASDTKDMTNSLHGSLYYCIKNRRVKPAVCYLNEKPILYVNSHGYYSHKCELEDHYSVYEDSDMLCISVRTTGDGGTYTVHTDRKTSTFKHQKSKELAEPTETCRPQNCSHESCSCCVISTMAQGEDRVESPMLQVKESSWKELELLNCVGENLVSNESVTITTPRVLHSANAMVPPSTGTSYKTDIAVAVAVTVPLVLLVILALGYFCKNKAKKRRRRRRRRCWGSAGSQGSSQLDAANESV